MVHFSSRASVAVSHAWTRKTETENASGNANASDRDHVHADEETPSTAVVTSAAGLGALVVFDRR